MDAAILHGAFDDPSRSSQSAFRALLAAFAEPGTTQTLSRLAGPPAPLPPGIGTLLLTLADADTPVFMADAFGDLAPRWLAFQAGVPITPSRGNATFAVVSAFDPSGFCVGSDTYPDRSTTLLMPMRFGGPAFTLSGPGILTSRTIHAELGRDFADEWAANRALFPRGVDLVLVDGASIVALPRTTAVEAH